MPKIDHDPATATNSGVTPPSTTASRAGSISHSLDWFIGSWSEEDTRQLDAAIEDLERLEEEERRPHRS